MITTYGTLKTAIADFLARDDLTSYIPYFYQGAQAKLNKLRLRHMESAFSGTIASGVVALPSGYLETKQLRVVSSGRHYPLARRTIDQLYQNYPLRSSSGLPVEFAREGSNYIFGPYPDSNYSIAGVVYTKPTDLSVDADTNWWILNNPLTLLYACLVEAEPFIKNDARLELWQGKLNEAVSLIRLENEDEELSGGGLTETLG
jgi:hypothetical protein